MINYILREETNPYSRLQIWTESIFPQQLKLSVMIILESNSWSLCDMWIIGIRSCGPTLEGKTGSYRTIRTWIHPGGEKWSMQNSKSRIRLRPYPSKLSVAINDRGRPKQIFLDKSIIKIGQNHNMCKGFTVARHDNHVS